MYAPLDPFTHIVKLNMHSIYDIKTNNIAV